MKVGDLVKDKRDGELGIIVSENWVVERVTFLEVYWSSVGTKLIQRKWLEVICEGR
jgi:hypothetical protein